jgi:hypothetical protein
LILYLYVICVLVAAKRPLICCAERGVHSFLLAAEAGLTAGGPGRALVSPGLGKRPPHDPAYAQVTASQGGEEVNLDCVNTNPLIGVKTRSPDSLKSLMFALTAFILLRHLIYDSDTVPLIQCHKLVALQVFVLGMKLNMWPFEPDFSPRKDVDRKGCRADLRVRASPSRLGLQEMIA